MSDLECCERPEHEEHRTDEGVLWRCASCGEWWTDPEYNSLVIREALQERREDDWFNFGNPIADVK